MSTLTKKLSNLEEREKGMYSYTDIRSERQYYMILTMVVVTRRWVFWWLGENKKWIVDISDLDKMNSNSFFDRPEDSCGERKSNKNMMAAAVLRRAMR